MTNASSSSVERAIDIVGISALLLRMDKYMLFVLYISGILGAILNFFTFSHKEIRKTSCSMYFLCTAVTDFCIMNLFILMEIITTLNKPLSDEIYNTRTWCKLGNYLMFVLPCLSSTYITMASFDRFCISSLNANLRKISQSKVSCKFICIIFLFWSLFGLHIPIAYERLQDPVYNYVRCTIQTSAAPAFIIIDGFFFALYNGAIVPFFLCIFGLLILRNMRLSRQRVLPQPNVISNRSSQTAGPSNESGQYHGNHREHQLILLILAQVLLTIILNIPYIVLYLFAFYNRLPANSLNILLYIIFSFIARWFYYFNYCKTFYINTLTSGTFRRSLRKQFVHLARKSRIRLNL